MLEIPRYHLDCKFIDLPLHALTQLTEFPTPISEIQLTGYLQNYHIKFFHQLNFSLKCEGAFTPPGHRCSTITIYMLVFYNNE